MMLQKDLNKMEAKLVKISLKDLSRWFVLILMGFSYGNPVAFMLTLFSGCPFPGVRCLWSSDLRLIARETTKDSWTWTCKECRENKKFKFFNSFAFKFGF